MSNLKSNQHITPFLFDGNAEEAMALYTSIFPNSKNHLKEVLGQRFAVPVTLGHVRICYHRRLKDQFFLMQGRNLSSMNRCRFL